MVCRVALIGLLAAAAPIAAAGQGAAAPGAFIGAGLGVGLVSKRDLGPRHAQAGPSAVGRVGVGLSRRIYLILEGEMHHLVDGDPEPGSFLAPSPVYRTSFVLLSTQVALGRRWFVRPGVGLGLHDFVVGSNCDALTSECATFDVSNEAGLAAGVAAGVRWPIASRVAFVLEGVGRWSQGEDSSSSRQVYGLQAVAAYRF